MNSKDFFNTLNEVQKKCPVCFSRPDFKMEFCDGKFTVRMNCPDCGFEIMIIPSMQEISRKRTAKTTGGSDPSDLLTVQEAAQILKLSPHTVSTWVCQKKIKSVKVRGTWVRISRSEIMKKINAR